MNLENWNYIVTILQLGFPGLVFLLALLSFRLIAREQNKPVPNADLLRAINAYRSYTLIIALLTVVAPFLDVAVNRQTAPEQERIRIERLVLLEEPEETGPLTRLIAKNPPAFKQGFNKMAFATSVGGFSLDRHGRAEIELQVIMVNLTTGLSQIRSFPVRRLPDEWRSRLGGLSEDDVAGMFGDLEGRTIFAAMLQDPVGSLGEGRYALRLIVRDRLNGTFAEVERSIDFYP